MATDVHFREQRLRKQAELQSLRLNLANLRKQEATYIEASAGIPELLTNQINEIRHEITTVEDELLTLNDESIQSPARQFYQEALVAELAEDLDKATKLYKSASRYAYPDASAALRRVRYSLKTAKNRAAANKVWMPAATRQSRNRLLMGLAVFLILLLIVIFGVSIRLSSTPEEVVALEPTATPTPPAVILIIPDTPIPIPTLIPTDTPTLVPTSTPAPVSPAVLPPETATPIAMPTPTLRAAPKVVGPQDELVWKDGAVVFEFENLNLAYDELYCLNTLRGFDQTNTENWSFPPVGRKEPFIPIEANVFRIAKAQEMRCIVWSASIGKETCENIISQSTEERIIGLPQPCNFK